MTVNGLFLMRTVAPTGLTAAPNSFSATVAPSTTTFVPPSTSESVMEVPSVGLQFQIRK